MHTQLDMTASFWREDRETGVFAFAGSRLVVRVLVHRTTYDLETEQDEPYTETWYVVFKSDRIKTDNPTVWLRDGDDYPFHGKAYRRDSYLPGMREKIAAVAECARDYLGKRPIPVNPCAEITIEPMTITPQMARELLGENS
jgi:hypothetical protein